MDYLVLLSSIILGAATVIGLKLNDPRHVKVLNAFTGAYLLTLVMLHLLPDLYEAEPGVVLKPLVIGGFILFGFFLQIAMDTISMGIEHGHAHEIRGRMAVGILAGLCIHAFVEAMALGQSPDHQTVHDKAAHHFLLVSVVVHNYPISIALLGMLLQSGMKRSSALACLGLFAIMAPIGMFTSTFTGLAVYSHYLMAIVIGIFMHISTTILFESEDHHRFPMTKLYAVIVGLALGISSIVFES
ncbi:MAG TPA: ZIP family metal transporter [Verrucomicrobiae bacterium]|nr:ZIP family metal transporter [Verrucomicrobiae bacterium]